MKRVCYAANDHMYLKEIVQYPLVSEVEMSVFQMECQSLDGCVRLSCETEASLISFPLQWWDIVGSGTKRADS